MRFGLATAVPCFLLLPGCTLRAAASSSTSEGLAIRVSMIQLLASPEHFEGRRVQVQGFCRLESEDRALYLNHDDAEYVNIANSIWLEGNQLSIANGPWVDPSQTGHSRDEGFVIVEGTFTAKEHGHLGLSPAAIRNIARLETAVSHTDYQKMVEKEKANKH